jgi:dihydrodipicolinate synthase/N-acetylneuraminate lyase
MVKRYAGVVVPMVTPFNSNNELDESAVARIANNFTKNNVSILALGTTGESPSVMERESRRMIRVITDVVNGKVDVYACLSGNCVEENISNARAYIDAGANVIVSLLPSYYCLTPLQMLKYFETVANSIEVPLMIYNIPATTNMSIPLDVVEDLSQHPNIQGFKDSERDFARMEKSIELFRGRSDFSFFVGYAAVSAKALRLGADGIVPSTGNFVPGMFKQLYDCTLTGQWEKAEELQAVTDEMASIYQNGRPLGESLQALKVMMSTLGLCETHAIPPLTELENDVKESIVAATKKLLRKEKYQESEQ